MEPSGAGCPTTPTENRRPAGGMIAIGAAAGSVGTAHEERITLLLSATVRGVRVDGRPAKLYDRAALPYGLRIEQIEYPKRT